MSRVTRWVLAACVAAAVLVMGAIVLAGRAAQAPPDLPRVTPAALIASTLDALAKGRPQSGSLSATLDLGLPDIVDVGGLGPGGGVLSLLTGTHTLKIWRSGDGFRISELETAGERGLFVSHGRAWAWDFDTLTAYDLGPPPPLWPVFAALGGGGPGDGMESLLASVSDTTSVKVEGTSWVAGRPVYRLVIAPRQPGTLVGAIEIDVDSKTRLPLGLSVSGRRAARPSVSVEFTSVSFDPIDPAVFRFSPPPGARVRRTGARGLLGLERLAGGIERVRAFGRAWTTVFALRVPPIHMGAVASAFLQIGGPLLSIRVADREDHSWILVGAVPQSRLLALEQRLT